MPDTPMNHPPMSAEKMQRLQDYWRARGHFFRGQLSSFAEARLEAMFASLAASPDFATSYFTLLTEVEQIAAEQPDLALGLLGGLMEAHPHRPEARALRLELFGR